MLTTLLCAVLTTQTPAAGPSQSLVDRFLAPDANPLASYRALRHLRASTRNGRLSAEMDVITALDPEHGFTFEIIAERGSSLIRQHVLLAALLAEQRTVSGGARRELALIPANYDFLLPADSDASSPMLDVHARRRSPMLLNGTLFLNLDASLVRVEGELSKPPSFWTRKVRVTRRYDEIGGVHVPVDMDSVADVRVVGTSTFEMSYRYLEINGRKVD